VPFRAVRCCPGWAQAALPEVLALVAPLLGVLLEVLLEVPPAGLLVEVSFEPFAEAAAVSSGLGASPEVEAERLSVR
jgi:hypothetical protein